MPRLPEEGEPEPILRHARIISAHKIALIFLRCPDIGCRQTLIYRENFVREIYLLSFTGTPPFSLLFWAASIKANMAMVSF